MEYGKRAFVSLSHLRRMAVLAQRAVDCATKAYAPQDTHFCLQLQDAERSLHDLQRLVAERGRNLEGGGPTLDDSVSSSCTLQIYSGLQITFVAAREISQNALFLRESRPLRGHSPLRWQQAARIANSLVTLNLVALFNKQVRFAELVLQARQHPGWPLNHARVRGTRQIEATVDFEGCVAQCLREIADQAVDIACAIVRWLGSENYDSTGEFAVSRRCVCSERRTPALRWTALSSFRAPGMANMALPETIL